MKKKLIFLALLAFLLGGMFGCDKIIPIDDDDDDNGIIDDDNGGDDDDDDIIIDIPGDVTTPTNLEITDKLLKWDSVENATSYTIFINGAHYTTVTENSYNFSAIIGNKLIFNVVSNGGQGVASSSKSLSLAYHSDPQQQIDDINDYLLTTGFTPPLGFVEELVRKGMTVSDVENLDLIVQTLLDDLHTAEGPLDINGALTTLLANNINFEAIMSAGIIMLPALLEDEIQSLNDEIAHYQDCIDNYGPDSYCEYRIEQLNRQIEIIEVLINMVEDMPELALIVAMNSLEYILALQAQVDTILPQITGLLDHDDFNELFIAELVLIKDEVVDIFTDTMPSIEEMTLLYKLSALMASRLLGETDYTTLLSSSATQYATVSVLSFEASLKLIDTFDLVFFTDVLDNIENAPSQQMATVEIVILTAKYIRNFQIDNEALLTSIDNVFTEAQKKALYEGYVDAITEFYLTLDLDEEVISVIEQMLSKFTYEITNDSTKVVNKLFENLFIHFIETDGELLRQGVIYNSFNINYEQVWDNGWSAEDWNNYFSSNDFNWDYYYDNYWSYNSITIYRNDALGITYLDSDEYYQAKNDTLQLLIPEIFGYYNASIALLTESDLGAVIDLILVSIPFDLIAESAELTNEQLDELITLIETTLDASAFDVLTLINNIVKYLDESDLISDIYDLDYEAYYIDKYGEEYWNNEDYFDDIYSVQNSIILFAKHIDGFFTASNKLLVEKLITDGFAVMKSDIFLELSGFLLEDVTLMETNFVSDFNLLLTQSTIIKDYDVDNLTPDQELAIEEFGLLVTSYFQNNNEQY